MNYPKNEKGMYILTVWDLEELHFIAEDVITGLRYERFCFDSDGNYIMDKIPKETWPELIEKAHANARTDYLNFRENEELHRLTFHDAVRMLLDEIKEKYLKDVLPVTRGILRKDTSAFADCFVVSDEVPDSHLDDLLALRWRENLKLWTTQWDRDKEKPE